MEKKINKILSISVAAYNIESMIEKNLKSFVTSSVRDELEIIVTDDGSKDNTAEIVKKYENDYPGIIKLVKKVNEGPGSTVNSGIKNATGKYFKMVDGDDWVETENLEELIKYLKNNDIDMVLNNYEEYNNMTKQIEKTEKINLPNGYIFKFEDVCRKLKLQMHNVIFKTSILKDNNLKVDNGFYTDVEYLLLPMEYIKTVVYLDLNIYVYRVNQSNQSVSIPSMQRNIKQHNIVLNRLLKFYENNKEKLENNKKRYIKKEIAVIANNQLGTLLTFEITDTNKKNIEKFNEFLRKSSKDIYNVYKKFKKSSLLICSNYKLYKFIATNYQNKVLNNRGK